MVELSGDERDIAALKRRRKARASKEEMETLWSHYGDTVDPLARHDGPGTSARKIRRRACRYCGRLVSATSTRLREHLMACHQSGNLHVAAKAIPSQTSFSLDSEERNPSEEWQVADTIIGRRLAEPWASNNALNQFTNEGSDASRIQSHSPVNWAIVELLHVKIEQLYADMNVRNRIIVEQGAKISALVNDVQNLRRLIGK